MRARRPQSQAAPVWEAIVSATKQAYFNRGNMPLPRVGGDFIGDYNLTAERAEDAELIIKCFVDGGEHRRRQGDDSDEVI